MMNIIKKISKIKDNNEEIKNKDKKNEINENLIKEIFMENLLN